MSWIDWAALALFFICWLGYGPILSFIGKKGGSLNDDMAHVRAVWMRSMAHREIRLVDSQLMGHSINSASFFASTNLLLIAAVGGILFGGESALQGFAAVGAETVPMKILEAKLALVIVCLTRGFLDFIWALRQMNYTLALIGSAPEVHSSTDRRAFSAAAGQLLNPALSAFSQGVRGYYFALAAAAWLFGPLWLALGVASAFGLLIYRQEASPAARAIRNARRLLEQ
ncbi:MAG: DUF599 domain-containing protein [Brevundimonas sp.]|uniref:DUF599 domain-containing protein n=1 Tax=Brevundimonas sp. TaxID=1871086 RepID=UPI000DB59926|nr:DUF599 family protein [Brevundimonas sp.]PZT99431.1 MAG: DUF599 domain-containing protein [Brevundimonas sp.]